VSVDRVIADRLEFHPPQRVQRISGLFAHPCADVGCCLANPRQVAIGVRPRLYQRAPGAPRHLRIKPDCHMLIRAGSRDGGYGAEVLSTRTDTTASRPPNPLSVASFSSCGAASAVCNATLLPRPCSCLHVPDSGEFLRM
jgi:hypothetical protein